MRERIGPYRLVRRIGEGGMGVVYEAQDTRLGRQVAIKLIREQAGVGDSRERFWREARSAARISHPHICQIFDVGEDGDDLYLAMELLDGEPLAARAAAGPLAAGEAGRIALGVLGALDALHRSGIIHRDLKPSNIFLTSHGVKLLDFGLARAIDTGSLGESVALTQTGAAVGTPRYMAPEQWTGDPVDARTDLFAVGAVLFEVLAGSPAFPGHSVGEVRHSVLFDQPPALSGPPVVAALDRVIRRALAKAPADRFPTAIAMAEEMRRGLRLLEGPEPARARTVTRLIALPFRLLRADAEIEFLCFSLPDAITATLSSLDSIVVRSSAAASRYDPERPDLAQVAAEADVDHVLMGTLLRAGDQVRASTSLVEAPSGTVLWSKSFQASMGDLFQLQDSLARQVVESLSLPLSARERNRLERDVPGSARAYEFYLRANELARNPAQWGVARDLYSKCLEDDPKFAPAWAQIGRLYRVLGKYTGETPAENYLRAADAFARALEINPDLPAAHQFSTALEAEMNRAKEAMVRLLTRVRQRGNDPHLFAGLVQACRYCGLLEASVSAEEHARRLDPNVPTSAPYTYFLLGQYEKAIASERDPLGFMPPYALATMGRVEEAIRAHEARKASALTARAWQVSAAQAALLRGETKEALGILEEFRASSFRDPEGHYYAARAMAYVGAADPALDYLAAVIEQGFYCPSGFVRDPWWDPVRGDARFLACLRRAEERHREARAAFVQAEGERVLGVPA